MDQKKNEEVNFSVERTEEDVLKEIHSDKSYVGIAWLNLLLYYLGFYIIGLIVNLVFLSKSKETMNITNKTPPGRGCLKFLLWSHTIMIPIILIIVFITIPIAYHSGVRARSTIAQTTIKDIQSAYNAHYKVYGTTDEYDIENALEEIQLGTKTLKYWDFEVIGNPPIMYIATSKFTTDIRKQVFYYVEKAEFRGYGINGIY